jgi:hypothetical protein
MSKKSKKPLETFTGNFSRIPHAVMDSQAFIGLSDRGKSLLFALIRQINGNNNGRLQLTNKWLSGHGWQSHSSNSKAVAELIERELIVVSRLGGLNAGCNWYAVTWLQISNFLGLDITAQSYKQGSWADCKLPQTVGRKPPQKQKNHPGNRDSTIPTTGTGSLSAVPMYGTKKANFGQSTIPVYGNNVSIPYTTPKPGSRRIVGRSRKEVLQ